MTQVMLSYISNNVLKRSVEYFYLEMQNPHLEIHMSGQGFPSGTVVKNPPAMQEPQETWVQSLGQEEPLEEAHGSPLQHSFPMDRGAWRATVHGVAKSQTGLRD